MSEYIPVTCPCGNTYDAGQLLACAICGASSTRARIESDAQRTLSERTPAQIYACACGRTYNHAVLPSCPVCHKPNKKQTTIEADPVAALQKLQQLTRDDQTHRSGAGHANSGFNKRIEEEASRRRKLIAGWVGGGVCAVVILVLLAVTLTKPESDSSQTGVEQSSLQSTNTGTSEIYDEVFGDYWDKFSSALKVQACQLYRTSPQIGSAVLAQGLRADEEVDIAESEWKAWLLAAERFLKRKC